MAIFGWLITPAVIATVLFAALPLYDPTVRWTRRLKNDIQIAGGLPDGAEKDLLNSSLEEQARRLRLYRQAFRGRHAVGKWVFVVYFSFAVFALVAWPPNPKVYAAFDWLILATGATYGLLYATLIGTGLDMWGRTPLALVRKDRVRRYRKRRKAIGRLEKLRPTAIAEGRKLRASGSQLGFETQVDPLAEWVRTWEMRSIAQYTGMAASGLSDDAVRSLRGKGLRVPNPYR